MRNRVLSCRSCNESKGSLAFEDFLDQNPDLSRRVLANRREPLAAAGMMAELCLRLGERLRANGLNVRTTTGADTAWTRRRNAIDKTHANDAACCGATGKVTRLRTATKMKAVGHGRRKQIKALPVGACLAWRHSKPAMCRKTPAPFHAHHPNTVHGVRTGDLVRIRNSKTRRWTTGWAKVAAGQQRVAIRAQGRTTGTGKAEQIRKVAPANGYEISN